MNDYSVFDLANIAIAGFSTVTAASLPSDPLLLLLPQNIALPILFTFGAGYSLWLGNLVYGLRDRRRQFRFEFLYFAVMSVLAIIVLGLGFAIPYVDHDYFYYFYNHAVALGVAIMVVALVGNPNLIGDLTEAARAKYGASTLREVDVDASLAKLDRLMTDGKVYQNEGLSPDLGGRRRRRRRPLFHCAGLPKTERSAVTAADFGRSSLSA